MKNIPLLLLVCVLLPLKTFAADPVDQTRLYYGGTWEGHVGVTGGLPDSSSKVIFQTIHSGDSLATFNTAIQNCPSNQVVKLDAFTNAYNGDVVMNKSGVILVGSTNANGTPATSFKNTRILFGQSGGWDFSSSSAWTTNRVTAGVTRGSTVMTFSSVAGLTAGRVIWFFSPNTATVTGGNWSDMFGNYPGETANRVVSIAGNDVTLEEPFNPDYWSSTIGVAWKGAGSYGYMIGVENVYLQPTDASAGYGNNYLEVRGAVDCWIKNFHSYDLNANSTHHIWVYGAYRLEVRHCDISRMRSAEGAVDSSDNYCILMSHSHNFLVEDNIFHRVPNVMPMFGCSCSAYAFNFWYDAPYGNSNPAWLSQGTFTHGSHLCFILLEGNWQPASYNESGTSGSRYLTFFRGRHRGYDENPTQGVPKNADNVAICLGDGHFKTTIAGCVLGDVAQHTVYRSADTVAGSGPDTFPTVCIHSHTNTTNTLSRIGNYNVVTVGVPSDETIAGGDALLSSYLHSSKPTWFGNRPWPLVDPSNYTQSNQRTNWPAGVRFATALDTPQDGGGGGGGPTTTISRLQSGRRNTVGKIQ